MIIFKLIYLLGMSLFFSHVLGAQELASETSTTSSIGPNDTALMIVGGILIPIALIIGHKIVYPIFRAFFVSKSEKLHEEYSKTRFDTAIKLFGTWCACVGGTWYGLLFLANMALIYLFDMPILK